MYEYKLVLLEVLEMSCSCTWRARLVMSFWRQFTCTRMICTYVNIHIFCYIYMYICIYLFINISLFCWRFCSWAVHAHDGRDWQCHFGERLHVHVCYVRVWIYTCCVWVLAAVSCIFMAAELWRSSLPNFFVGRKITYNFFIGQKNYSKMTFT